MPLSSGTRLLSDEILAALGAMRRIPGTIAIVAAALVAVSGLAAQPAPGTNLEVLQVRPNFYMIAGAGGNIGFQVGADGVVVVDSGSASSADAVVAAIKKVTTQPIRYVINTSADPDHVGGNAAVAKAGQTLFTQTAEPVSPPISWEAERRYFPSNRS